MMNLVLKATQIINDEIEKKKIIIKKPSKPTAWFIRVRLSYIRQIKKLRRSIFSQPNAGRWNEKIIFI